MGLNFCYVAFEVSDIEKAIEGVRALGITGLSVTIPHKVSIIPYLDSINPLAENIGAINTVVQKNGKLIGINTDGPAVISAIQREGITLTGSSVGIIGTGGVSRAAAFSILYKGQINNLDLYGIVDDEGEILASDLKKEFSDVLIDYFHVDDSMWQERIPHLNLLVNCSPIGMSPNVNISPMPLEYLREDLSVFDVVYNPIETKLLMAAKVRGAKIVSGIEMFIDQAAAQFELWTETIAPREIMAEVVYEHFRK
jgi:shikimate dehydrogenase